MRGSSIAPPILHLAHEVSRLRPHLQRAVATAMAQAVGDELVDREDHVADPRRTEPGFGRAQLDERPHDRELRNVIERMRGRVERSGRER